MKIVDRYVYKNTFFVWRRNYHYKDVRQQVFDILAIMLIYYRYLYNTIQYTSSHSLLTQNVLLFNMKKKIHKVIL